jgi:hypothetical protein
MSAAIEVARIGTSRSIADDDEDDGLSVVTAVTDRERPCA